MIQKCKVTVNGIFFFFFFKCATIKPQLFLLQNGFWLITWEPLSYKPEALKSTMKEKLTCRFRMHHPFVAIKRETITILLFVPFLCVAETKSCLISPFIHLLINSKWRVFLWRFFESTMIGFSIRLNILGISVCWSDKTSNLNVTSYEFDMTPNSFRYVRIPLP